MNTRNISLALATVLLAGLCNAKAIINCTSKADFDSLIAKNSMVVVDFHGEAFCAPCRAMIPTLEAMAKEFTAVQFVKIDTMTVKGFDEIRSVPAFYFYKDGKKVADFVGSKEKTPFRDVIKSSFGL